MYKLTIWSLAVLAVYSGTMAICLLWLGILAGVATRAIYTPFF